jgi:hypothetical protein
LLRLSLFPAAFILPVAASFRLGGDAVAFPALVVHRTALTLAGAGFFESVMAAAGCRVASWPIAPSDDRCVRVVVWLLCGLLSRSRRLCVHLRF